MNKENIDKTREAGSGVSVSERVTNSRKSNLNRFLIVPIIFGVMGSILDGIPAWAESGRPEMIPLIGLLCAVFGGFMGLVNKWEDSKKF